MAAGTSALYQPELFREELPFEDAEIGRAFPPFAYAVTPGHVEAYVEGIRSGVDGAAVADAVADPLFPSLVALNFGFIYSAMGCRPPTGFLNTSLDVDLIAPIEIGAPLTMTVSVEDRQIKRERKFVTLKAMVADQTGASVAATRVGCIFP